MNLAASDVARRKFAVTRKGYDPDEVTRYLEHVAAIIAELEAAAAEAATRAERREMQLHSLQAASEDGMHRALAGGADDGPGGRTPAAPAAAAMEAERIVAAATDHATRLREQAESALAKALATTALIEADQERLLAEAREQGDTMLADAKTEAAAILAEARLAAMATREDAQRFAEELRELTATETIELVSYAKAMAAAILERAGSEDVGITVEGEDLTIELRETEPTEHDEQAEGLGGTRPSRYESQSAHLPPNEEAASTIDSVESLRDQ